MKHFVIFQNVASTMSTYRKITSLHVEHDSHRFGLINEHYQQTPKKRETFHCSTHCVRKLFQRNVKTKKESIDTSDKINAHSLSNALINLSSFSFYFLNENHFVRHARHSFLHLSKLTIKIVVFICPQNEHNYFMKSFSLSF